jgi:spermidine synthase
MKTVHHLKGLVHNLIVTRKGAMVTLWSEGGVRHTVLDIAAPHQPGLEYARNMLAALAFCPQARSCLVLGLGGGSIPRMLLAARPDIEMVAVEIDPAVIELAARYFELRELPRLTVHLEDAAAFVRNCTSCFGIIVLDTYVAGRFPEQCTTPEFVRDVRKCLQGDGVLAINWLNRDVHAREALLKSIDSSIGQVWQLRCVKSRNILYFASMRKTTRLEVVSNAEILEAELPFNNSLRLLAHRIRNSG